MNPQSHTNRTHCIRCGECCMKSSPTLQISDLQLLENGTLRKEQLYTIRAGELIADNIRDELRLTDEELMKLREKPAGGCIFHDADGNACTIYENRPAQCAAFACWDAGEFMRVYDTPKLIRRDLVEDGVLLGLMEKHEERCGYNILEAIVKDVQARGEQALGEILEIMKFDYRLRPFVAEKLGIPSAEMDFLFGRPVVDTITMFGLKVVRDADGGFLLTTLENGGS
ncbi:MAG: YkgJ family cysteine cluster protein [Deltaproteobacteria bacterium]|nr:YkgJ family cysteine cluster protein [Deltaproteobacteria bacterium]